MPTFIPSRVIFNAALTGTQFLPSGNNGVQIDAGHDAGFIIVHPAGTTTAYSVQVSNLTDEEIKAGLDDWTDYGGIATLTLSAAGNDYIEALELPFTRCRLKAVTTVGSGTATVRVCVKPRS